MTKSSKKEDDHKKADEAKTKAEAAAIAAKVRAESEAKAQAEAAAKLQAATAAREKAAAEAKEKAAKEAEKSKSDGDCKDDDKKDHADKKADADNKHDAKHEQDDKSHKAHDEKSDEHGKDKAHAKSHETAGKDSDGKSHHIDSKSGDNKSGDHCDNDDDKSHHQPEKSAHSHDKGHTGGGDDCDHTTPPVVTPPVVTPPVVPKPVESLILKTVDVSNVGDGALQVGSKLADAMNATTGHDTILGNGGNDLIHGVDAKPVSLRLDMDAALVNALNADAVAFVIKGVPSGSVLTAGHNNGDGSWSLTKADLPDLAITTQNGSDFVLKVTATATDGSGLVQSADLHVTMHAGEGNVLSGGNGSDTIYGSANGDDYIYGGNVPTGVIHATHVPTAADNDVIFTGNGNAHVWGQAGDDQIWGGAGQNWIYGGSGNDTIHAGTGEASIRGNGGDDVIFASTGRGALDGGAGDDVIKAVGGTYAVNGGAGFDTLDFSGASNAVAVDLNKHTASGAGDLTVKGVEAIFGSTHDDVIWGNKFGNNFTGGAGNDTFGFHTSDVKNGPADHVTDFGKGDRLDLSEMLHGRAADGLVKVTDGQNGLTVSVKVGGSFHDVVVLDGVHGMTTQDMLAHGMILA